MVRRTPQSQIHHDLLVKEAADFLVKKAHRGVKADAAGYERPGEIVWDGEVRGQVPDVRSAQVIVEVETDDTLNDGHTADQWKLFSTYAAGQKLSFWIGVPSGSVKKAEDRLKELGILARVWNLG